MHKPNLVGPHKIDLHFIGKRTCSIFLGLSV